MLLSDVVDNIVLLKSIFYFSKDIHLITFIYSSKDMENACGNPATELRWPVPFILPQFPSAVEMAVEKNAVNHVTKIKIVQAVFEDMCKYSL